MSRWRECDAEYTVAMGKTAAGSYRATVPAPVAEELGRPAKITFRRNANRFVVVAAGQGAPAPGPAAPGPTLPAAAQRLAGRAPSETSLEVNILRYLPNCLERRRGLAEGCVVPVSPTARVERTLGFDSMADLAPGRYVALQFKRPGEEGGRGPILFDLVDRQALALLRYPAGSAFVLSPVQTNGEMSNLGLRLLCKSRMVDVRDTLAPIPMGDGSASPARARGGGRGVRALARAPVE